MEDYKTEVISRRNLRNVSEVVKRVERRDDTKIQPAELKTIFKTLLNSAEQLKKDKGEKLKILCTVNTGVSFFTFSSPDDIKDEIEYWMGKVKSIEKFTSFDHVDFTIFKYNDSHEKNLFLKK